jgi:heat shock protein HslJ
MRKYIAALALIAISPITTASTVLTGQPWDFDTLDSMPVDTSRYQNEKPNIAFSDNGRFTAYAGCNRIAGGYKVSGQELIFSPNTIMTKMACPGNEDLENNFVNILPRVKYWSITDTTLTLTSSDKVNLATFKSSSP